MRNSAAPAPSLRVADAIALALIVAAGFTRQGFETLVEYTAPVFWLFFLLTGVSLFLLRRRDPRRLRPFRVPLYPLTPLVFCATSACLLYGHGLALGPLSAQHVAALLLG